MTAPVVELDGEELRKKVQFWIVKVFPKGVVLEVLVVIDGPELSVMTESVIDTSVKVVIVIKFPEPVFPKALMLFNDKRDCLAVDLANMLPLNII